MLDRRDTSKETFLYVLKKRRALLIFIALVLVLVLAASFLLQMMNRNKVNLHTNRPPGDLGLKPTDILSASTEGELGTVLTETTVVSSEYFSDAVFIGDSLTEGIRIYDVFGEVTVISKQGINSHSALEYTFYDPGDGVERSMVDAIEFLQPRKVYIMLGTNGINWESVAWNLEGYDKLIDALKARIPGSYIVIQSIPPATVEKSTADSHYARENVAEYNAGLLDIAMRKGVYFLDVHAALSDENDYLRADIAAADGLHLKPSGYQLWYDCVVSRAVKGESAYAIDENGRIKYIAGEGSKQTEPDQETGDDVTPPSGEPPAA